jgi:hypothetical protein
VLEAVVDHDRLARHERNFGVLADSEREKGLVLRNLESMLPSLFSSICASA